jgi:hypothetical protein
MSIGFKVLNEVQIAWSAPCSSLFLIEHYHIEQQTYMNIMHTL